MTSEELDTQRIALVATLATHIWAGPDGPIQKKQAVRDAMEIIALAEQAVRTPTGDAS